MFVSAILYMPYYLLLAYYGVAITREEIYNYAMLQNLRQPPIYDRKIKVMRNLWSSETSIELMGKKFNFPLQLRMPLNVDYHIFHSSPY